MSRIAVVAGHSVSTPGYVAFHHGSMYFEHTECRKIVDAIVRELKRHGIDVFDPKTDMLPGGVSEYLQAAIGSVNAEHEIRPFDAVVQVHLNACDDEDTNYALVEYSQDSISGASLASTVAVAIGAALGSKDKPLTAHWGTDIHWSGKRLAWLNRTIPTAILTEACFLSSSDAEKRLEADSQKFTHDIALAHVKGILDWLNLITMESKNDG